MAIDVLCDGSDPWQIKKNIEHQHSGPWRMSVSWYQQSADRHSARSKDQTRTLWLMSQCAKPLHHTEAIKGQRKANVVFVDTSL